MCRSPDHCNGGTGLSAGITLSQIIIFGGQSPTRHARGFDLRAGDAFSNEEDKSWINVSL
jgi:hypothetical protein